MRGAGVMAHVRSRAIAAETQVPGTGHRRCWAYTEYIIWRRVEWWYCKCSITCYRGDTVNCGGVIYYVVGRRTRYGRRIIRIYCAYVLR